MKVAMYYNNNDVRIEEMDCPKCGDKEILVMVNSCGICGTDVLEWYRLKKAPLVLGHEMSGTICEIGKMIEKYKIDDRVFVSHHIPCNTCHYCLSGNHTACETLHTTNFIPGGFSEYLLVPELNVDRGVFTLPPEISFEEGVFIEPLACVLRSQRLVSIKPGQSVLILGAGLAGLLQLLSAKALGAGRIMITDINGYRLNSAKKLGAEIIFDASKEDIPSMVRKNNNGLGVDHVIVCTGALVAFQDSLKCVDRGGTILFFATTGPDEELHLNINDLWRNGIKLMPSYGNSPLDATIAIEMISTKRINVKDLITHRLDLTEAGLGFKLVSEARECIKVILKPNRSD